MRRISDAGRLELQKTQVHLLGAVVVGGRETQVCLLGERWSSGGVGGRKIPGPPAEGLVVVGGVEGREAPRSTCCGKGAWVQATREGRIRNTSAVLVAAVGSPEPRPPRPLISSSFFLTSFLHHTQQLSVSF